MRRDSTTEPFVHREPVRPCQPSPQMFSQPPDREACARSYRPLSNIAPPPRVFSAMDLASLLLIVLIWGSNFVVMKIGLRDVGPMMLGALRFAGASLPLLFFVRRPDLPWRYVASYGLAQGFGQFGLLFLGLSLGLPAGIASIVLQTQVFFTALIAAAVLKEPTRAHQWAGLFVAATGLVLIATAGTAADSRLPLGGLLLTVGGALMWAVSNIVARLSQASNPRYDAVSLVVWSSCFPVLPFLLLAAWQDGVVGSYRSLISVGGSTILAVLYLALAATVLGYSLWARLLKRHPATRIAPFSLAVPVVGLFAAWVVFDEQLSLLQWAGTAAIGAGLLLNNFGGRMFARLGLNRGSPAGP